MPVSKTMHCGCGTRNKVKGRAPSSLGTSWEVLPGAGELTWRDTAELFGKDFPYHITLEVTDVKKVMSFTQSF